MCVSRFEAYDADFKPSQLDGRFKNWTHMGITSYFKISSNKRLNTFQQLTDTYNLEQQDFFRYLQMKHYFDKTIKTTEEKGMNLINIFIDAYKGTVTRKLISQIYSALQQERGLSTMYIKSRWGREANTELTEDAWLNVSKTQLKIISIYF